MPSMTEGEATGRLSVVVTTTVEGAETIPTPPVELAAETSPLIVKFPEPSITEGEASGRLCVSVRTAERRGGMEGDAP